MNISRKKTTRAFSEKGNAHSPTPNHLLAAGPSKRPHAATRSHQALVRAVMSTSACCPQHVSARVFLRQRVALDTRPGASNRGVGAGKAGHARRTPRRDSRITQQNGCPPRSRVPPQRRPGVYTRASFDTPSSSWHVSSEALGAGLVTETLCVLETNLDDLSPQIVAYAFEELLASGALDVWSCPVQMKKGRTGVVLSALCDPETVARLAEVLFKVRIVLAFFGVPGDVFLLHLLNPKCLFRRVARLMLPCRPPCRRADLNLTLYSSHRRFILT